MPYHIIMAVAVFCLTGTAARTRAQAEAVIQPLYRLLERCGMHKWPYVACTIILAQAHQRKTRERLLARGP